MEKEFPEFLKKILESKLEELKSAPASFQGCKEVYRCNLGKDGLPIFLGIEEDGPELSYKISLGDESNVINLDINKLGYLITGLNSLLFTVQKEVNNVDLDVAVGKIDKFIDGQGGITISKGVNIHTNNSDLKNLIDGDENNSSSPAPVKSTKLDMLKEMISKLTKKQAAHEEQLEDLENSDAIIDEKLSKEIEEQMMEIENFKKDMQRLYEEMSPEERMQYNRELQEKQEELQAKKMREFEKSLLGDIKTEEDITYTYEHFKKILDERGQEAFKEEIAKIPKHLREEIIQKVVKEYKQQKYKNEENIEEADVENSSTS